MHVPQAGDEEAAGAVDHVRIVGREDLVSCADRRNAVACYENRLFGMERPIHNVDNGDAPDRHRGRLRLRAHEQEKECDAQEVLHDLAPLLQRFVARERSHGEENERQPH